MSDPTSSANQSPVGRDESLVYVMPQSLCVRPGEEGDKANLIQLWRAIWRGRWIILSVTAICGCSALAYALLATEWWRVEVLLSPVEEKSMPAVGGTLGGLAALAGVSLGSRGQSAEALAVLRSRQFAADFIRERDLLPTLFADEWDPERKTWLKVGSTKQRDLRDGVKKFHDDVLTVTQDNRTKLVTLVVEWTEPNVAAGWADDLVQRLNKKMRERAQKQAEDNVAYLQAELSKTSVVALQQAIGRLVENEMQTLMIARGSEEFAFRVLDAPSPPKFRVWPNRPLVVVVGFLGGGILGLFVVLVISEMRKSLASSSADSSKE